MSETQNQTQNLGSMRWVQFAFIGLGLFAFWIFDKLVGAVWELLADQEIFSEPDPSIITGIAALLAFILTFSFYKSSKILKFVKEVISELSQVVWPDRDETWKQTVVVIAVSAVSALIIGFFDIFWLKLTNLIMESNL